MGRLTVAVSVFTGLILMLSACTQESDTDIESATKLSETSPTLRIAAAANLSDVLPDIIKGYQADKALDDQSIDVTYASSGKLYTQIKAGAPYDIYLSANQEFPAKLAKEKASQVNGSNDTTYQLFTYTQGQLALYSVSKPL
ncbi:MAG: substrate-binding domain-containing protein, partial [Psychrobacter sp.]